MKKKNQTTEPTRNPDRKTYFTATLSILAQSLLCGLFFVYQELVFHIFTFQGIGDFILYPILFSLPTGMLLLFLTGLFPEKVNRIILRILLWLATLLYIVETIFEYVFKIPLLVSDLGTGNFQVVVYYREIFAAVAGCLPAILLLLLPLILYEVLLRLGMKPVKKKSLLSALFAILALLFSSWSILAVYKSDRKKNNIYDNYFDMHDTATAMEYYGVLTTLRLNIQELLSDPDAILTNISIDTPENRKDSADGGAPDSPETPNHSGTSDDEGNGNGGNGDGNMSGSTQKEDSLPAIDTSPNMVDIDFSSLAAVETNSDIQMLHQYFASLTPTSKHKYTGMFRGYNLIHITAEAFSPYCVDEQLTHTLYKLVNNGFVFENYYVPPTGESTCGGEFMNMTGLLTNPKRPRGVFTFQQTADNYMPYGLGNVFSKMGVTSYAYHNNSLSYYNRIETIPNLGYKFKAALRGKVSSSTAAENGLLFEIDHPKAWPQSDLEMMSVTGSEYITPGSRFHAYYMTVSGHTNYNFSGNEMAKKHQQEVSHLPYSEACRAYIACNMELDQALENLMGQLEAAGVLDKTVICLTADHYPYGLTNDQISEFAGHKIDTAIEQHKSNLILWNSAMKNPVKVDKVCSTIDILPTLLNLFGVKYDSRLLAGKDILSDADGFVWMTGNGSYLYGNVMYNSRTKAVTDLNGNAIEVSEEELTGMKNKGELMITMNRLLIENDYYNVIREYLE